MNYFSPSPSLASSLPSTFKGIPRNKKFSFLKEWLSLYCMEAGSPGWMNGWIDRWMDGRMNRWMDGWIDGWKDE